jgi:GntR family transcriptional regulator
MATPQPALAIVIDSSLDEAVYAQIARQIREAVASGGLSVGVNLPSVRVLASDLGVNLNTVARAYRMLDEEGFVAIESRSGVSVAAAGSRGTVEMRRRLTAELEDLLVRMRQVGFGASELQRLVLRQIAALPEPRRP